MVLLLLLHIRGGQSHQTVWYNNILEEIIDNKLQLIRISIVNDRWTILTFSV